ncbi:MAG: rRNA maturation RNase YbeY [Candidatus Omnitrophica bacterium]|nr:rRNA maturation RNase YbeY [Candidatus Omnitrophota bacterium]
MNKIKIKNQQKKTRVNRPGLEKLADMVLRRHGVDDTEVSVILVDDRSMRVYNKRYLHKDRPTDVLAFRMADGKFGDLHPELLGDIIISTETARRQAGLLGLAPRDEIALYLVHGLLHLLGYTDTTQAGFRRMDNKQKELLEAYAST